MTPDHSNTSHYRAPAVQKAFEILGFVADSREEVGISVSNLEYCGQHRFQFVDGYSIHVWVYRTRDFAGEPVETREAKPFWVPIDRIPYEKMWEDDRYWLPMLIRGQRFQARWIFDGDRMLDYEIETDGTIASWGEIAGPVTHGVAI